MATSTVLRLRFGTMAGVKTWSFKYADDGVTNDAVKALAQAMIDNGSIYKYPPLVAEDAKIIETTETDIQLS